jgi:hypothetical protein
VTTHKPTCPLHPQKWLRNAAAAAGALTHQPPSDLVDRKAAVDALAYVTELGDLTVTLQEIIDHALVMDEATAADLCECGALNT